MTLQAQSFRILPQYNRKKRLFANHLIKKPAKLPHFVRRCPVAMRYLELLGPLAWHRFPERGLKPRGQHQNTLPYAVFAAAHLVKLDQGFGSLGKLWLYLQEHPGLTWLLGFPVRASRFNPWYPEFQITLPRKRHFNRILRNMPNTALQVLLDSSVHLLKTELADVAPDFGQAISLDTKHILAWVKENNPRAYVKERYNKNKRLKGDPDARLGVKRRRNIRASSKDAPATPADNPKPGSSTQLVEYYWGYASGVVAVKVPHWGEFVLAELTQPFDKSDISYFFPLMAQAECRLGFRPKFGAFDAAFDAFYVYEHFYSPSHHGFAAVPFSEKGGFKAGQRKFADNGWPLCQAGFPMPRKQTFTDRTRALITHQRAKYACPLVFPHPNGDTCPIAHARWQQGGCTADMPTSIGARIRYQLDREDPVYKDIYNQRTATERINSQAKLLGIERPNLRNQAAITNQNTLIYILINLRALRRIRAQRHMRS